MIRQLDDRTFVSGQIRAGDVAGLAQQGVATIVCNRPDGEDEDQPAAAEIERAAEAAGIAFRNVPVIRGIGPSDVEAVSDALEQADGKVLLYCRSGNRSTLLWAVARRSQGASIEEIEEGAERAGIDLSPVAHLL